MRIGEIITPQFVLPNLAARTKDAVIEELSAHVAASYSEIDEAELTRVLTEREALSSTAIGHGVAIPHAKLSSVDSLVACLGRSKEGIDFDSIDGDATYLFVVLVAPDDSTGEHLKALARISRLFRSEGFRKELMEASSADEIHGVICRHEN